MSRPRAVSWISRRLKNPDLLVEGVDGVPLAAIDELSEEGIALRSSVNTILNSLGKADADRITIEDASDTEKIFAETRFNGDGVITEKSTDDESIKEWIREIIDCYGGETDRSGGPGLSGKMGAARIIGSGGKSRALCDHG